MGYDFELFNNPPYLVLGKGERDFNGITCKYWYNINGKDYLFKCDDKHYYGFGELVYCFLGKKLGFNSVNVYPAKSRAYNGVIVESFLTKDVKNSISLKNVINKYEKDGSCFDCYYSVQEFMALEKKFKRRGIQFDPNLEIDLKKMVLVDFLLLQIDRHWKNVEFIVRKDGMKKTLSLAPIFDNGMSMGLFFVNSNIDVSFWATKDIPKLTIDNRIDTNNIYQISNSIANAILNDKDLKMLYNKFKQLDMKSFLNNLNKCSGYNLSPKVTNRMAKLFEKRMEILNESIKNIQNENKNKKGENIYENQSVL